MVTFTFRINPAGPCKECVHLCTNKEIPVFLWLPPVEKASNGASLHGFTTNPEFIVVGINGAEYLGELFATTSNICEGIGRRLFWGSLAHVSLIGGRKRGEGMGRGVHAVQEVHLQWSQTK